LKTRRQRLHITDDVLVASKVRYGWTCPRHLTSAQLPESARFGRLLRIAWPPVSAHSGHFPALPERPRWVVAVIRFAGGDVGCLWTPAARELFCRFISSFNKNRLEQLEPSSGASRNAGCEREEPMVVQTSRRAFVGGLAATATAAASLPVPAIARDTGGASEELAYRTADDL